MDLTSIIAIAVAVIAIYFIMKFIVSPIIKAIFGLIVFLVLIYFLQRIGVDFDKILSPLGISLNLNGWIQKLGLVFDPIGYYIGQITEQIKKFLNI